MTVTDFEMARGRRVGQDDDTHERWKDLADLTDGHREKWMTDRAKHALGTPKLASIFLQEEKGRINRLRKIKSVLASGKLIGNGGGTTSSSSTQPDRRGRRRPYPQPSQQYGYVHHTNHRRFQQANDASLQAVQPNYPTKPFGNVNKDALQQFPAPMGRKRTSLEEAVRNGWKEATSPQATLHNVSSIGRSGKVWDDDTRAIQDVVSVLAGSKQGLSGSRSDLPRNSKAPSATGNENNARYSQYGVHSSSSDVNNERGQLRHSPESLHRSRAEAEGSQGISSGPSAIDLFDQCGLVPVAAVEKEGLVGTTDTIRPSQRPPANSTNTDARDLAPSVADSTVVRYPVAPALVASRPPLVPGGPSSATNDSRGARNHPRDGGRHEARAARTKRAQPAATHGVKPRPPFAGGSVSTSSRTKQAQQRSPSLSGKDAAAVGPSVSSRSAGRGAPSDATITPESSSRSSRMEGSTSTESRARRRWNIGDGTPTATTPVPPLPNAPPRSKASSASGPVPASSLSASEQRIASAKERLHKDKDLDALKSEHVEALSILQDISCPSIAANAGEAGRSPEPATGRNDGGNNEITTAADPGAMEAARIALLHERKKSSANSTAGLSVAAATEGEAERQGPPVDDKLDELSADLPRIGSKEQAALRMMYRKWWMKVANGGSPPSPCTPVGLLEGDIRPVAQQPLPTQRGVTGGDGTGTAESLAAAAAADISENGRSSDFDVAERRKNGDPSRPRKESSSAATVEPPTDQGVVGAAVAAAEKGGDLDNPTCATGEFICRVEENVESPTGKKVEAPPAEDGDMTGSVPLRAEMDAATHPVETQDGGEGKMAAARDTLAPEQQQQQQGDSSDVGSVSEDDGLEKEQEEGHHGRIYLPDGRFVSTWRNSSEETAADGVAALQNVDKVGGEDGCGEVLDASDTKQPDDESLGYADEDFEFED